MEAGSRSGSIAGLPVVGCLRAVGLTAARFKPNLHRYAECPGDREGKSESVSALLRSALAFWSGGQSACGRLNITLRYANRRAVTALAWLQ